MPKISQFYGITVSMNYNDHPPPHFHVKYGDHKASVSILSGRITDGALPDRAFRLVHEWWALHRAELDENWRRFEAELPLLPVDPL
jgi:hypothetical protein